ncbi:MAG: hypothetical protein WBA43_06825 [Elainellaceae cyanobacterium]
MIWIYDRPEIALNQEPLAIALEAAQISSMEVKVVRSLDCLDC